MKEPMSLTKALKDFFGFKPDQNLSGFVAEVKALTAEDRAYFKAGLEQNGYTITEGAN